MPFSLDKVSTPAACARLCLLRTDDAIFPGSPILKAFSAPSSPSYDGDTEIVEDGGELRAAVQQSWRLRRTNLRNSTRVQRNAALFVQTRRIENAVWLARVVVEGDRPLLRQR